MILPPPSGVLAAKEGQIHKKAWQGRRQNYAGLFWTTSSSTKFKSVSSMNREMCWRRFHHFLIETFEALPGLFVVAWSGRRLSVSWSVTGAHFPLRDFFFLEGGGSRSVGGWPAPALCMPIAPAAFYARHPERSRRIHPR